LAELRQEPLDVIAQECLRNACGVLPRLTAPL
jgi:hypothetical protein